MNKNKITVTAFILMVITSVFGVANIGTGFLRMGYAAIPMFIIAGIVFFIPFSLMMIELGTGFNGKKGGIYTWMSESVNPKYAFIGIMMWYSSYIIWMFGKAYSVWVPLSIAITGKDITAYKLISDQGSMQFITPDQYDSLSESAKLAINSHVDFMQCILGVLGVLIVILLTYIVANGASKLAKVSAIGGIAVILMNAILLIGGIIALLVNGMTFQEPLTISSLFTTKNTSFQSFIPFIGFIVFAIFAYGGSEAIAGIADNLENPKRDLKKAIFISSTLIIVSYVFGFLMTGAATNWENISNATSLSAIFIIMQNLGDTITGVSNSILGQIFMRFSAIGMFLAYIGAFVALSYAPLKQLIEGSPKEIWPESFQKENKNGIKVQALKVQALIVIMFVTAKFLLSLVNPEGSEALFDLIIAMTNVGMTIPYLFLIYAWYKFRKNDKLNKEIIMVKNQTAIVILFILTFAIITFGNLFNIVYPFLPGADHNIMNGIWTIAGPVIFLVIALAIYTEPKKTL